MNSRESRSESETSLSSRNSVRKPNVSVRMLFSEARLAKGWGFIGSEPALLRT